MSFSEVLEAYRLLRRRLVMRVGDSAFKEVGVALPKSDCDELSFLRLAIWSYATLQEAGRVALKFLQDLPPMRNAEAKGQVPEAIFLRTWATHNLLLASKSDKATIAKADEWFRDKCGAAVPVDAGQWRSCFSALCEKLRSALAAALAACDLLDDPIDGASLVEQLKLRIERNWDAYQFDRYVEEAAAQFGYQGLDVVAFRRRYLERWRDVVATAEDGSIDRLLRLRVEADLLTQLGNALPVTALELLGRVGLQSPSEVAAVMLALRLRGDATAASVDKLLAELSEVITAASS